MREIDWLDPDAFPSNGITQDRIKGINKKMMKRIMADVVRHSSFFMDSYSCYDFA
jgi:hypothetical protein